MTKKKNPKLEAHRRKAEFDKIVKASWESNMSGTVNNQLKSKDWKTRRIGIKRLGDYQYYRKTGKPPGR